MPMYNLDPNDTRPLAEQFSDVMDYLDEVYDRDTTGDATSGSGNPVIVETPAMPELPMPHYHVLSSMAGYLPDYNEIHDTRDDAREDAAWYVEAYDDMNASSDEYPEYYDIDARDPDYIIIGRGGPDSYAMPIIVEVVECLDHICERETD